MCEYMRVEFVWWCVGKWVEEDAEYGLAVGLRWLSSAYWGSVEPGYGLANKAQSSAGRSPIAQ